MREQLDISLEDLSPKQRQIAEIVGIEAFIELSKQFGGGADFYIMKYSELKKISDDKQLVRDFDGYNQKELAKKYDVCLKTVYNKTAPQRLKRYKYRKKEIDGQLMF